MSLQNQAIHLYVTLCFLIGSAWAQEPWHPDEYYGIPVKDKLVRFIDEFENNQHQWDLGSLYLDEEIENGEFRCVSHSSHSYTKQQRIDLRGTNNFEVELYIRFAKGISDTDALGLTFGRDSKGNEFNFVYTPNLQFRVSKYDRNREYDLSGWQHTNALRLKHGYNRLTIRQVEQTWFFFINKQLVHEMNAQPLFGDRIGFTLGGHMAIEVDFISVTEISSQDTEGPKLSLIKPRVEHQGEMTFYEARQIIQGQVYDASGVKSLTINGRQITVSPEGMFTASILLPEGKTDIEIIAEDRFHHLSQKKFSMSYVSSQYPTGQISSFSNGNSQGSKRGNNYLLLIGINNYSSWNPLHNAVKDCRDLAETLTAYYQFESDKIFSLFNENASRENILETFEGLQEMVTEHDNLLIYYAGHGYYDEFSELGYWVPVDARLNKIPDFIRNSTIHDYLRTINSKNTLLIADACYAGSLFATYRGQIREDAKSRWAFTSGDIEKVWDGQPGQNSPFARYLIDFLKRNQQDRLPANELIEAVGAEVQRNTAQNPQGSPLRLAGDNGGIFVFYRK